MCGIVGFWTTAAAREAESHCQIETMCRSLHSRGPDAEGVWGDRDAQMWMGHRRLSIIDLSAAGRQPMRSSSGRYVLSYNGEIYNFEEIRKELESLGNAPSWAGGSDTEVLLAAFDAWGLTRTLHRIVGMFAFALWDRHERRLHLGRDRLGIKPLCYGRIPGGIAFASDTSALRAHPGFDPAIDRGALAAYLRFNCVPAPFTIHEAAQKVPPGCVLTFDAPVMEGREESYWSAETVLAEAANSPLTIDDNEALDLIDNALRDAVRARLVSDVRVGAFLSGGIDSSLVVALMQQEGTGRVRTFSIGNERAEYDEGVSAANVARHLGTEHTNLTVSSTQAVEVVPTLARIHDEPFSDSSQIPTFILSRMAREHVTVALSGDGGDEVFGGYNRHVWAPRLWRVMRGIPRPVRGWAGSAIERLSPSAWSDFYGKWGRVLPRVRLPGDKLHKLATLLPATSPEEMYLALQSSCQEPTRMLTGTVLERARRNRSILTPDFASTMMLQDLVGYLPDDILTKVDRASMAVSLEARVPLLDHRVVELAWRLRPGLRAGGGTSKRALRLLLSRYVPPELWERPKMGFGVPVGEWLRGPLREWSESVLDSRALREAGFFDPASVQDLWRQHLTGQRNWQHVLWSVLMFHEWLAASRQSSGASGR